MSVGPAMIKVGAVRYREEDAILLGIHPSQAHPMTPTRPYDTTADPSAGDAESGKGDSDNGHSRAEPADPSGGEAPSGPAGASRKAPRRATRKPPKGSQ